MPNYRRAYIPGGTYFFTLVTAGRRPILCTPIARRFLREAMRECNSRWPFAIGALVLLPDHMHLVATLPAGDSAYSRRIGFIKKEITRAWLAHGGSEKTVSRSVVEHRRRGVWQRKFWERVVRDEGDFEVRADYCYWNPVKHGLVKCPHEWPYSTFHRDVKRGLYTADWGCSCGVHTPKLPDFRHVERTSGE